MRPKIVSTIVICGLLAVGCLLALHLRSGAGRGSSPSTEATADSSFVPPQLPAPGSHRLYGRHSDGGDHDSAVSPVDALTPEQQEDAVNQRILELSDLAVKGDSASLGIILSELTNDNAEIRRAALDAVIQSGNLEAIPALQQLADRCTDPQQKLELAEAIEFMRLPSLSDVLAARGSFNPQPPPRSAALGRQ